MQISKMKRNSIGTGIALALAIACPLTFGQASNYPNRPIKIVVPFPPGNTTDIMTRLIASKLQER
jgi:tripartite-type tricarboxylate transporter receptor subunit TctC